MLHKGFLDVLYIHCGTTSEHVLSDAHPCIRLSSTPLYFGQHHCIWVLHMWISFSECTMEKKL